MKVLTDYVENIFVSLPKTDEMEQLKCNMIDDMEEKYTELLANGKSESEAVGIVITEFGNVDELLQEYDVKESGEEKRFFSDGALTNYFKTKRISSIFLSTGVAFFMIGVALYMYIEEIICQSDLSQSGSDFFSLVSLMICIASGIGMCIYSSMKENNYKDLKQALVSVSALAAIDEKLKAVTKRYHITVLISIVAFVISPVIYSIGEMAWGEESNYPSVLLFLYIAFFTWQLIYIAGIKTSYDVFYYTDEVRYQNRKNQTAKLAALIIGALSLMGYFIWSFCFGKWSISWVIFLISAPVYFIVYVTIGFLYKRNEA